MEDNECLTPKTCGVCHNCQKPGHLAEDCPEKKPSCTESLLTCTGCFLTDQLARKHGWSEEVNTPPWSWLEDEVIKKLEDAVEAFSVETPDRPHTILHWQRERLLQQSAAANQLINRLTEINQKLVLDAADRQVALEKAESQVKELYKELAQYQGEGADAWDVSGDEKARADKAEARVKELQTALEGLVQHDQAADKREGLEPCLELQKAKEELQYVVPFLCGDGTEEVILKVKYIAGGFPRDEETACAFCHGDPLAENSPPHSLIAQFFKRNEWAETCPCCGGAPS